MKGEKRGGKREKTETVGVHKCISPHTSHRGVFWCFSGYERRLSESGMGLYGVVAEMSS